MQKECPFECLRANALADVSKVIGNPLANLVKDTNVRGYWKSSEKSFVGCHSILAHSDKFLSVLATLKNLDKI